MLKPTQLSTSIILTALAVVVLFAALLYWIFRPKPLEPLPEFKETWLTTLEEKVNYYRELDAEDKSRFRQRMRDFMRKVEITGIDTEISDTDRVYVAASGIIPTFGFLKWNQYPKLDEVLLYKTSFREGDFATTGADRRIAGMVGGGFLNGKLLLSRPSLYQGFEHAGRGNTGIHEFVHLLDKADGDTDGIPAYFMDNSYVLPWLEMIRTEMEAIERGESDIDDYATTNKAEFFAVVAEYFFNRPAAFAEHHPKMFRLLEKVFQLDMDDDGVIG